MMNEDDGISKSNDYIIRANSGEMASSLEESQLKGIQQAVYRRSQDIMLQGLEDMMPEDHDFSQLAQIFEKQKAHPATYAQMNYSILKYFVKTISENTTNNKTYQLLEEQAQKLQSTIRSHIKIEQEMKMYLDYLQAKITNYQVQLSRSEFSREDYDGRIHQLQLLKSRQTVLMKEKIILLKKNEQLTRQLDKKNQQIKILQRKNKKQSQITYQIQPHNTPYLIAIPQARREHSPEGQHSYRKPQSQAYSNNPKIMNLRLNLPKHMNQQSLKHSGRRRQNSRQNRNHESTLVRKSDQWEEGSVRKKTEQPIHYQSVNTVPSEVQIHSQRPYTWRQKESDRIMEKEYGERGYKKLQYEKVQKNIHNGNRMSFLHEQQLEKDTSQKSFKINSARMNLGHFNRKSQLSNFESEKHPQTYRENRKGLKLEYERHSKPNHIEENRHKTSMSFHQGPQKSYSISIHGANNSMRQQIKHSDHEVTQKKSSHPQPGHFQHQRSSDNINVHSYVRTRGNGQK